MVSILANEYSHSLTNAGCVELDIFSKICANRITARFQVARYQQVPGEPWKQILPAYITSVISVSNYSMSVAIAALSLVERYQDTLRLQSRCGARNVGEVCRLFLVGYMAAAKVMHDEHPNMKFWARVAGYEYTPRVLSMLEMQFYQMVDWKVRIDPVAYAMIFGDVMKLYHSLEPPPPPYQATYKREITNPNAPVMFLTENREEIPLLDDEDEQLFARALASPTPNLKPVKRRRTLFGFPLCSSRRS